MMKCWRNVAALLLLVPSVGLAAADNAAMPGWMTGAWLHAEGEEWADEYWTPPRGDMMIGASRSGKGDRLLFWEHMRIVREDDGNIAFWAVAGDQKAVRFALASATENAVVFENAAHDYPQRIRYWREGKALKAEISAIDGSRAKTFGWEPAGQ